MCSFQGRLCQLVDSLEHCDSHRTLIDRVGQEFCLECSLIDLHTETSAVLHKTHVCHCLEQIISSGLELETLCKTLLPALVSSMSMLGVEESSSVVKLKEVIMNLVESIQLHISPSEVTSYLALLVDTITTKGCSKQPHLVSLLGQSIKAAGQSNHHHHFLTTLCSNHASFLERLFRSSLASSNSSLLCDVLFIFSFISSEPIVLFRSFPNLELNHSSEMENSQHNSYQHGQKEETDINKSQQNNQPTLSQYCLVIFQCVFDTSELLVGHMEKIGHEGCWTNFLVLLAHFATAMEASILDGRLFFETLVFGQNNNNNKNNTPSSQFKDIEFSQLKKNNHHFNHSVRLGVSARAQLVQTTSPTSACAAARLFSSLSRQNSAICRQLLRDGVGEFAITGLDTHGSVRGALIKEALAELLNDLSSSEPIAFFHPSHFHPFALDALLKGLNFQNNEYEQNYGSGGGNKLISQQILKSTYAPDSLRYCGPLAKVLLRSTQHSSIIDNLSTGDVIDALCRAALVNLSAGLGAEVTLHSCLIALVGLLQLNSYGNKKNIAVYIDLRTSSSSDDVNDNVDDCDCLVISLMLALFHNHEIIHMDNIAVLAMKLASLWLQGISESKGLTILWANFGASWVAEIVFGARSGYEWDECLQSFPQCASLIADLLSTSPTSLLDNEALSLAQYLSQSGFLMTTIAALVHLSEQQQVHNLLPLDDSSLTEGVRDEEDVLLIRGFIALAGHLVGLNFPISDGLIALIEEISSIQSKHQLSLEYALIEVISNITTPLISPQPISFQEGRDNDDTGIELEAFEIALFAFSHSATSVKKYKSEISVSLRDFFNHRFQPNQQSTQQYCHRFDWAGLRGGIHALHLVTQLGSMGSESLPFIEEFLVPPLASCFAVEGRGQPLITALGLGIGVVPLLEIPSSQSRDSILFLLTQSNLRSYEKLVFKQQRMESMHINKVDAMLSYGDSSGQSFRKFIFKDEHSYQYQFELTNALISHLLLNFREMTVEVIVNGCIMTELLILPFFEFDSFHDDDMIIGDFLKMNRSVLSSPERVSSFHKMATYVLRTLPEAAPLVLRSLSRLLIQVAAELIRSQSSDSPSSVSMPPPKRTKIHQFSHHHSNHFHFDDNDDATSRNNISNCSEMLTAMTQCAPLLAYVGEDPTMRQDHGGLLATFCAKSQSFAIAALTALVRAVLVRSDHSEELCQSLYQAHGKTIGSVLMMGIIQDTSPISVSLNSSTQIQIKEEERIIIRSTTSLAFVLALTSGLKGPCFDLPLPPPLMTCSDLLNIIDPLSTIGIDESTNTCNAALISVSLHIVTRYLYINEAVSLSQYNKTVNFNQFYCYDQEKNKIEEKQDRNDQDDINHDHRSQQQVKVSWWTVGSRQLTRLTNAACHHALSPVPVVAEAAHALLIILWKFQHSEVSTNGWLPIVFENLIAPFRPNSTSSSSSMGQDLDRKIIFEEKEDEGEEIHMDKFGILFLSMLAQHDTLWVKNAFSSNLPLKSSNDIFNTMEVMGISDVLTKYLISNLIDAKYLECLEKHSENSTGLHHNHADRFRDHRKTNKSWIDLGATLALPCGFDWASGLWEEENQSSGEMKFGIIHPNQLIET